MTDEPPFPTNVIRGIDFGHRRDIEFEEADRWLRQNVVGLDEGSVANACKNLAGLVHDTNIARRDLLDVLDQFKEVHAGIRLLAEGGDLRLEELRHLQRTSIECQLQVFETSKLIGKANANAFAWSHWWNARWDERIKELEAELAGDDDVPPDGPAAA